jgi:pimeloyl-ACP methyl ester carboxylesterase
MLLPDDYYKSFQQVVEENGFKFEQHEVETEDGYLLTVFRVMNAEVAAGKKQPVVFMQHGLMDTADTWIMNFAEKAPGFMIAKAGYDVWFGNNRGNSYSNKHKTLDPVKDEEKFHDYGFRELGLYDMPAQIDMVLEKTGAKTVTYFGHS